MWLLLNVDNNVCAASDAAGNPWPSPPAGFTSAETNATRPDWSGWNKPGNWQWYTFENGAFVARPDVDPDAMQGEKDNVQLDARILKAVVTAITKMGNQNWALGQTVTAAQMRAAIKAKLP
mgnify:CR=1 FL=1|jgi:hypothetical protein|tara:strand:- start:8880 stop:9242 length:363 start_codon:yes stop_codon:yes gene_type:complete